MMLTFLLRRIFTPQMGLKTTAGRILCSTALMRSQPVCSAHQAAANALLNKVTNLDAGSGMEIEWSNGDKSRFHSSWLRFNCLCEKCQQAASGQKTVSSSTLPERIAVSSYSLSEHGESQQIIIKWQDEDHESVFSCNWLLENSYSEGDLNRQSQNRVMSTWTQKTPPVVQYEEIMNSDKGLLEYLTQINEYGCSLVQGVPCGKHDILEVGGRIGPILHTIYGMVFQVVSTPKPINIAYSDVYLPLHMDLAYYQSPPGLQLLHCTRFDNCVVGGESILLDLFAVAEEFRKTHPEDFDTLVRVPATFQKVHFQREEPVFLKYQRPHIVLNHRQEIVGCTWSPAFEGPLFVKEDDVEPYYKAYRNFAKAIDESPLKLEFKLQEGELITFNNIRMLHGRNAFQLNGGVRELQGSYLNIDEFRKKVDVMNRLVGDGRLSKRVGNNCFL